ncbi:MAG: molybdenum cofactor guanylyltransferase [Nitrosomonadales bacterium]|nr:molybdenum cofactor guanylyltransferase [Nitrosomonadales bacterium]
MIEDCTALILAGGDSRRMGQDKAVLVLDGMTLLDHVTAAMQQVFPKVVVSVRQLRAGVEVSQVCDEVEVSQVCDEVEVSQVCDEVEVSQVCDEVEASGPLAGLLAGLAQADTPWVFAVACDMPFVTPAVVLHLATFRDGVQAVVPMIDGYPQPLAAFYAASSLEAMRASLAAGDKSLRGMLQKLDVRYVSEAKLRECDPQLRSFVDLDTPQDFQAAKK